MKIHPITRTEELRVTETELDESSLQQDDETNDSIRTRTKKIQMNTTENKWLTESKINRLDPLGNHKYTS